MLTQNPARANQLNGRQEVPRPHRRKRHRHLVPAVRAATAGKTAVQCCRELFDNRITPDAVHGWRTGNQTIPQWARERLAEVLEAFAAELRYPQKETGPTRARPFWQD